MFYRSMMCDQLDNDTDALLAAPSHEGQEILQRPVFVVDTIIVGDVVTVIPVRGGEEWKQPYTIEAKAGKIRQFRGQSWKVANTIAVGITEPFHVHAVYDSVLPPMF